MKKEKIGVAVITYNRLGYLTQCLEALPFNKIDECIVIKDGGGEQYNLKSNDNYFFYEYETNGGNCRSKNKAFEYLLEKKCKHIFLIEDDMLIKDSDIFHKYIETAYKTGIYHLMYLKVSDNILYKRATIDGIDLHKNPQGSFMYALDGVIKHVGMWDLGFKNAFTHVDWTYRVILKNLITPFWWFPDIENSQNFIEEIPGSTKNSSITNKEKYKENWDISAKHWVEKYGYFTNVIPDSSFEDVKKRMDLLKKTYAKF